MESMRWLKQISDTGVRTKSKKTTIFRETNWFSKQNLEDLLNLLVNQLDPNAPLPKTLNQIP